MVKSLSGSVLGLAGIEVIFARSWGRGTAKTTQSILRDIPYHKMSGSMKDLKNELSVRFQVGEQLHCASLIVGILL